VQSRFRCGLRFISTKNEAALRKEVVLLMKCVDEVWNSATKQNLK